MSDVRIILSGLWVALMLTYLLGDVLRIFAGDMTPGEMDGEPASDGVWLGAAAIMLVPILMVVLSLIAPYPANRWITIAVSAVVILFNLVGLPYQGMYDNFLIAVSFAFNAATIWYAATWTTEVGTRRCPIPCSMRQPQRAHRQWTGSRARRSGVAVVRRCGRALDEIRVRQPRSIHNVDGLDGDLLLEFLLHGYTGPCFHPTDPDTAVANVQQLFRRATGATA